MSNWLKLTNQKLYQARLLIDELNHCNGPAALPDALETSAFYHLHDAYLSYLHELADMVAWRQPVYSLTHLMESVSLVTGEMRELHQLEENSFTWLSQLLEHVLSAKRPNDQPHIIPKGETGSVQLIDLQNDSSPSVVTFYTELSDLIDRQRENRNES